MHLAIVLFTMLILPVGSVLAERAGDAALWPLIGKWFVFWGVGARLGIAGVRQITRPDLTVTGIFGVTEPAIFPLARELGFWNLSAGLVALATLWRPAWLPPIALAAGLFYAMAGILHTLAKHRNLEENTAMISDLAIALVLLAYGVIALASGA